MQALSRSFGDRPSRQRAVCIRIAVVLTLAMALILPFVD